jgi:hypothetical protein
MKIYEAQNGVDAHTLLVIAFKKISRNFKLSMYDTVIGIKTCLLSQSQ